MVTLSLAAFELSLHRVLIYDGERIYSPKIPTLKGSSTANERLDKGLRCRRHQMKSPGSVGLETSRPRQRKGLVRCSAPVIGAATELYNDIVGAGGRGVLVDFGLHHCGPRDAVQVKRAHGSRLL